LDLFERPPSGPHSAKLNDVIWHHHQQGTIGCKLLGYWLNGFSQIAWRKTFLFNKEKSRFHLENLRSARCSPYVFFKVLAARKTYLITARARKNKRTARMLASARKDYSIPLMKTLIFKRSGVLCRTVFRVKKCHYTMKERWRVLFFPNIRVRIKDNNSSPGAHYCSSAMAIFIFQDFPSESPDLNFASYDLHVYLCGTHSEPRLPVVW